MSTRESLVKNINEQRDSLGAFWDGIPDADFYATDGTHWSAGENVVHLIKSTRPVAKALRLPRLLLRVMFGKSDGTSRDYEQVRDVYLRRLSQGANAGSFAPRRDPPPADAKSARASLMAKWRHELTLLAAAVESWSEAGLDTYRLPHPLLGKLTLREMVHFTLYHQEYHKGNVERRMQAAAK